MDAIFKIEIVIKWRRWPLSDDRTEQTSILNSLYTAYGVAAAYARTISIPNILVFRKSMRMPCRLRFQHCAIFRRSWLLFMITNLVCISIDLDETSQFERRASTGDKFGTGAQWLLAQLNPKYHCKWQSCIYSQLESETSLILISLILWKCIDLISACVCLGA